MTADDYRTAIAKLGLSQVDAGRFLKINGRTSRRWALGEVTIPATAAMLLRLMIAKKLSVEKVCKILDEPWGDDDA